MALRDKERYFWLKLHCDFFKRHDIRVLEKKQNGKELVLLFLKLMTESLDHEGVLRFSEDLPYTEEMLACVTDTDPEVLRAGIQSFQELGMLQVQEDGTILIPVVERLVGSETHQNRRKREAMQRKADENPDLFLSTCGVKLTPEKEIESETNIETDTDTDSDTDTHPDFGSISVSISSA